MPNDADWHYGLAELLCWNAEWNNYLVNSNTEAWVACVEQIQQILDLNPNHEKTKELIEYYLGFDGMIDFSGSQPDYLILTAQPTTTLTPTETSKAPKTTATVLPMSAIQDTRTAPAIISIISTSTPVIVQTPRNSNVLYYFGGLILLFVTVFLVIRFKKT